MFGKAFCEIRPPLDGNRPHSIQSCARTYAGAVFLCAHVSLELDRQLSEDAGWSSLGNTVCSFCSRSRKFDGRLRSFKETYSVEQVHHIYWY